MKVGLIYGSDTGKTEEVVYSIVDHWTSTELDVIEISQATKAHFRSYDLLILGLSTWYDGDLQSDWEQYFDEFLTIDFSGITVALFGLGDQYGYDQYFIDGLGILAKEILKQNGNIIGYWPTKTYAFEASKALYNSEYFFGLAIDEDNQPELTIPRIRDWLNILEDFLVAKEGSHLISE